MMWHPTLKRLVLYTVIICMLYGFKTSSSINNFKFLVQYVLVSLQHWGVEEMMRSSVRTFAFTAKSVYEKFNVCHI